MPDLAQRGGPARRPGGRSGLLCPLSVQLGLLTVEVHCTLVSDGIPQHTRGRGIVRSGVSRVALETVPTPLCHAIRRMFAFQPPKIPESVLHCYLCSLFCRQGGQARGITRLASPEAARITGTVRKLDFLGHQPPVAPFLPH